MEVRVLEQLGNIVGPTHVLVETEVMASYAVDWTGRFIGHPTAVVRPRDSREVAALIALCQEEGVALVPQGGNTGLVGGSVPLEGELVLSLRRLAGVTDIDSRGGQLSAGAGTTVADIQAAAATAGWAYGVDLASRDSATVGGTIATNAGGLQVLRHGSTRAQVMGIEVVLGTGDTISHMGGLVKDNTGYDFGALLCGSEGTLGVVTAARLRLVPTSPERVTAILAFTSTVAAVDAGLLLRRALPEVQSLELFFRPGLELVCRVTGTNGPFTRAHWAYLLVEVAAKRDPAPMLAAALDAIPSIADVAVATDSTRRNHLWRYREDHTEAINTLGAPHKLDVTLPAPVLASFIDEVPGIVRSTDPDATTWLFGHVGDGNVHVNVTGVGPDEFEVDEHVMRYVAELGGSISSEHGIGTAKRRWLYLNRSESEIRAFRRIKKALDPANILNPNVLLPSPSLEEREGNSL